MATWNLVSQQYVRRIAQAQDEGQIPASGGFESL